MLYLRYLSHFVVIIEGGIYIPYYTRNARHLMDSIVNEILFRSLKDS